MTQNMRTGLGLLCVAAICFVIGERATGEAATVGDIALVIGTLVAVVGFAVLAVELLRPRRAQTKSSSGVRSSGDT